MAQDQAENQLFGKAPHTLSAIATEAGPNTSRVATDFAKARINSPELLDRLRNESITKIRLVYTTFRESPEFDQQGLNHQRLKNLRALVPEWFDSPFVSWELVAQTGCVS